MAPIKRSSGTQKKCRKITASAKSEAIHEFAAPPNAHDFRWFFFSQARDSRAKIPRRKYEEIILKRLLPFRTGPVSARSAPLRRERTGIQADRYSPTLRRHERNHHRRNHPTARHETDAGRDSRWPLNSFHLLRNYRRANRQLHSSRPAAVLTRRWPVRKNCRRDGQHQSSERFPRTHH